MRVLLYCRSTSMMRSRSFRLQISSTRRFWTSSKSERWKGFGDFGEGGFLGWSSVDGLVVDADGWSDDVEPETGMLC